MTARAAATRSISIGNNQVLFPPKFSWPRYVAWVRVLLAAVALVLNYLYLQPPAAPLFYSLMAVYLAYAIVIAIQGRAHLGMLGLLRSLAIRSIS